MTVFEIALKGSVPIISVTTPDTVNAKAILMVLSGKKVQPYPLSSVGFPVGQSVLYTLDSVEKVTPDLYKRLSDAGASVVVINPEKKNSLVFDAGELPTPDKFYQDYLTSFVPDDKIQEVIDAIRGLSLKDAQEIVSMTMARTGEASAKEVRRTRMLLTGAAPGLHTIDTSYDFYVMPKEIDDWITLNKSYYLNPKTPEKLVPRGLLLDGPPGVGKSMGAVAIANAFSVPAFRLDISGTTGRYLGDTETRVSRNLAAVESSAPCVLLMDEVEKIFSTGGDEGTIQRVMSQLLWWLQMRSGRVLTIMTTNDFHKIPKELYRPGRIDRVISIPKLNFEQSLEFACQVYKSVVGTRITKGRKDMLELALHNLMDFQHQTESHATITELVYEEIKRREWLDLELQSVAKKS
jgi:hypothetical protein